jgi:hypothetical protein
MPTFYVSALNQSEVNGTLVAFTGAVTTQPTVYDDQVKAGTASSVTDMQTAFKVYTTAATNSDLDATSNVTGVAKVSVSGLLTQTDGNRLDGRKTILGHHAQNVFGSTEATDFISNSDALMDQYDTDMNTMCAASSTSTSATASEELYNSMLSQVAPRFAMAYNATVVTANTPVGIYGTEASPLSLVQTNGSGATCTVEINASDEVARITIITAGTGYTFGSGNSMTIDLDGTYSVIITSANQTPIHAAFANGTLDATAGTSLPIEAADVVRIKFTIYPHASQTTASGTELDDNNIPYTVFTDFTVA